MLKQDQVSIIDAIERASEAELRELARIADSLKQLQGQPASNSPTLVVTRSLKRSSTNTGKSSYSRDRKEPNNPNERAEPAIKRSEQQSSRSDNPKRDKKEPYKGTKNGGKKENSSDSSAYQPSARNVSSERRNYRDVMESRGQMPVKRQGPQPARATNQPIPRKTDAANDDKKPASGRDASGRFVSREKSETAERNRQQKVSLEEQAKLQGGFFNRLGKMLSGENSKDSALESGGADVVGGAAVGGPIWTLGKGMVDLGKAVGGNVVSLKKWVDERAEGKENDALSKPAPAKRQTAVIAQPPAPPVMGQKQSVKEFGGPLKDAAADATAEQTRLIAANDGKIIDVLDDIKKAIHKQGRDGGGRGDLLGGRRGRGGRKGRNGKSARSGDASLPDKSRSKARKAKVRNPSRYG